MRGIETETWVRLPKGQRPAHFDKIADPAVPLKLALYGHPDAGGYREQKCDKDVKAAGFEAVETWPST